MSPLKNSHIKPKLKMVLVIYQLLNQIENGFCLLSNCWTVMVLNKKAFNNRSRGHILLVSLILYLWFRELLFVRNTQCYSKSEHKSNWFQTRAPKYAWVSSKKQTSELSKRRFLEIIFGLNTPIQSSFSMKNIPWILKTVQAF